MIVAAFNQEKALVGAFSVITNLRMELFQALVAGVTSSPARKQFKRCHGKCVQKFCLPIGDLSVYDSCSAKCKGEKLQYL